jgi:hypothetical protein
LVEVGLAMGLAARVGIGVVLRGVMVVAEEGMGVAEVRVVVEARAIAINVVKQAIGPGTAPMVFEVSSAFD